MTLRVYEDHRGWLYKVLPGLADNTYKARYHHPSHSPDTGWKCVRVLPWRESVAEAQEDLDRWATQHGMRKVEG